MSHLLNSTLNDWYPGPGRFAPLPVGVAAAKSERAAASEALGDAYASLESKGDIRPAPQSGRAFCQLTANGRARLDAARQLNAQRVTFARTALEGVALHRS